MWHLGDVPISLNAECLNSNFNAVYSLELGANAHPRNHRVKNYRSILLRILFKIYKPGINDINNQSISAITLLI